MRVRFPPTQDSIQNSPTLFDPVTCFSLFHVHYVQFMCIEHLFASSLLLRPMLLQIRALASTAVSRGTKGTHFTEGKVSHDS